MSNGPRFALPTGAILLLAGASVAVLFLMQPWRSCDYGEPADCTATPMDATMMMLGIGVAIIGLLLLGAGVARRHAADQDRRTLFQ